MNRVVKAGSRIILHWAGGLALWRHVKRGGLRILTYHGFPATPEATAVWNWQCEYIRKCYNPISMTQAAEHLRDGQPFPPNSLVVTVDDGYRDFDLQAWPVLAKWRIPALVYLVSDFLDGKDWLWVDKVDYAILNTRMPSLTLDGCDDGPVICPLETDAQRQEAAESARELLKKQPSRKRLQGIEAMLTELKVNLPARPPAAKEAMSWNEVRKLAAEGIEFGAHTVTHPVLTEVEDASDLQREVEGSKATLERELQTEVAHFSYPNGNWNPQVKEAVRQAGYQTAVTVKPVLNYPGQDVFLLNRIGIQLDESEAYFSERMAGLHSNR